MSQDEAWKQKFNDVVAFIKVNKLNPSKHDDEERGMRNWWKHQQKLMNAGELKEDRVEKFKELLEMGERYKRVNQYV